MASRRGLYSTFGVVIVVCWLAWLNFLAISRPSRCSCIEEPQPRKLVHDGHEPLISFKELPVSALEAEDGPSLQSPSQPSNSVSAIQEQPPPSELEESTQQDSETSLDADRTPNACASKSNTDIFGTFAAASAKQGQQHRESPLDPLSVLIFKPGWDSNVEVVSSLVLCVYLLFNSLLLK